MCGLPRNTGQAGFGKLVVPSDSAASHSGHHLHGSPNLLGRQARHTPFWYVCQRPMGFRPEIMDRSRLHQAPEFAPRPRSAGTSQTRATKIGVAMISLRCVGISGLRRRSLSLLAFSFLTNSLVAQTLSPALLVLEKSDNMLAIVDPASLKIVARVPAGPDPHEVESSSDGKLAYISNYGGSDSALHTISVVDLIAQKALPPIDLGALRST